jgi:hypothetical protein
VTDNTRPSQFAEIVRTEEGFRLYMVQKMERQSADVSLILANQAHHEKEDERRFADGERRMSAIESSLGGVKSSVNDIDDDRNQIRGAWKAIGIVALVVVTLSGAFSWLWSKLEIIFKAQP